MGVSILKQHQGSSICL